MTKIFKTVMHKLLNTIMIVSIMICVSCKTMTKAEKDLILSGTEQSPMRVLVTDIPEDSLILRKQSTDFNYAQDKKWINLLIKRLEITMDKESGVGIAAPQVGISRNMFLFTRIDKPEQPVEVAINPHIISYSPETVCFERDGCLSIPGKSGNTLRHQWVEVEYINRQGKKVREKLSGWSRTTDFTGVIFQHEFDHLRGILYIDRLIETK